MDLPDADTSLPCQQLGESNSYAPESAAITVDEGQLAWQTTASDYGPFR
jgi:hypothetical protein